MTYFLFDVLYLDGRDVRSSDFRTRRAVLESVLARHQQDRVRLSVTFPEFPPQKGRWSKRSTGSERWVKPTTACDVTFAEWTPDGHIRHPSFKGMRSDKDARRIRRQQELASPTKPSKRGKT